MIAQATHEQTKSAAATFKAHLEGQHATIELLDGEKQYNIKADFDDNSISVQKD